MDNRNIQGLPQPHLYLKTSRGRDIFKVYPSKGRGNILYSSDNLLRVFCIKRYGEGVYTCEFLKYHGLAFHNRHGCLRSYVTQSEHCSTVSHYSD